MKEDRKVKNDRQFCPRCGSTNITLSRTAHLGDPLQIQGMVGWDCLDCGYTGKDFFIVDEETYKEIQKGFPNRK